MKIPLLGVLLAVGATLGAASASAAENATYACTGANNEISFTNVPSGAHCEKILTYAAPVAAAPAVPAAAIATTADASPRTVVAGTRATTAEEDSDKGDAADAQPTSPLSRSARDSRLAQRRDDAIQETRDAYMTDRPLSGPNPAVNRRYLMISRAEYQQALGVTP